MGIFQRTSAIVSANVNDFVDYFERPDRMLRHALREMETLLASTSATVARSLAAERLLTNSRDAEQQRVETWQQRAVAAIEANDEPLARQAIARQLDHRRSLDLLDRQLAEARETNASLRRQLDLLRDKYAAAQSRMTTLVARQSAANARRQIATSLPSAITSSQVLARFEHFCQKLEFAEAEAVALIDIDTLGEDSLEFEVTKHEREVSVDRELARLRADLK